MNKQYDEDDIKEMIELIEDYNIEYDNCGQVDCSDCCHLEDCYYVARQKEDSEWVKLINYGGYDTEEEFWEELLG